MISNSEAITIRKFDIAIGNNNLNAIRDLASQLKNKLNTEEIETYSNLQQWQDIYYRIHTSASINENDKTDVSGIIEKVIEKTGKKRFVLHNLRLTILSQESYAFNDLRQHVDKSLLEPDITNMASFWKYLYRCRENFIRSKLDTRYLELIAAVNKFLKKREPLNREFFGPILQLMSELDIEYEMIYTPPDNAVSVFRDEISSIKKPKLNITQTNGSLYWIECSACGDVEKQLHGVVSHYCPVCGGISYPYIQDTNSLVWQKNYATTLFKAYRSPSIVILYPNKENIQNILPFIEESEYGDDQYIAIIAAREDVAWIKEAMGHIKYNICTQNNIHDLIEEIRLRCLNVHSADYLQIR